MTDIVITADERPYEMSFGACSGWVRMHKGHIYPFRGNTCLICGERERVDDPQQQTLEGL